MSLYLRILPFVLLAFLLDSCLADNFEQDVLDNKIAIWESHELSDYTFTYGETCFCAPEDDVIIKVVNNVVSEAVYTPSGDTITGADLNNLPTIPDIFDLVQQAIDDEVFFINIDYDTTYGFPAILEIDHNVGVEDDQIVYSIRDFEF